MLFLSRVEPSQMGERIHLVQVLFHRFIRVFSAGQKGIVFYMFQTLRVWIETCGVQVLMPCVI